ncbi:MAG: hypothetical protein ACLTW9_00615 [Enterocloster sp.]
MIPFELVTADNVDDCVQYSREIAEIEEGAWQASSIQILERDRREENKWAVIPDIFWK